MFKDNCFDLTQEAEWLVLTPDRINAFDEEETRFYVSNSKKINIKGEYEEKDTTYSFPAVDEEYRFDIVVENSLTYGKYGQALKLAEVCNFVLLNQYYQDIPESGFTQKMVYSYEYSNVAPMIL